jgi:hypothetical protein
MSQPRELDKTLLENALRWFHVYFHQKLVSPVSSHFPDYPLPRDIQAVRQNTTAILQEIQAWPGTPMPTAEVGEKLSKGDPSQLPFF